MVNQNEHSGRASGVRGQLGELCYSSGLLQSLQRMRSWWQRDLRILAYHRVMPLPDPETYDFDLELISTSPERFREQMQLIKRRFLPMRLSDVAAILESSEPVPTDAVVVTFDDGYDDNYQFAYPILQELGIPATFFVSTGHIDSGKPFAYDWLVHMILCTSATRLILPELNLEDSLTVDRAERRAIAGKVLLQMKDLNAIAQQDLITRLEVEWQMPSDTTPQDCRPMSWAQLREMHAAGFEIGSHGVHHRMLAKLPTMEMELEVKQSRQSLERELGKMPLLMSYPVGGDRAFDARVIKATEAEGFQLAVSYICGTNPQPSSNRYSLSRLPVERQMGQGWFDAMITLPSLMSYPTTSRATESEQADACSP